jgi:hypothetical protein
MKPKEVIKSKSLGYVQEIKGQRQLPLCLDFDFPDRRRGERKGGAPVLTQLTGTKKRKQTVVSSRVCSYKSFST